MSKISHTTQELEDNYFPDEPKKKMSQLSYWLPFFASWAKIALRSGAKIQFFEWGTKTLEV